MEFIEEVEDLRCRCCLTLLEDESMYNIFDCSYNEVELYLILGLVSPISIAQGDGKNLIIYLFSRLKIRVSLESIPWLCCYKTAQVC